MKKKALSIFLVVALVAIAATGTLAYFTADDSATNTFTVGNVAIDLEEPSWDSTGSEDAPELCRQLRNTVRLLLSRNTLF